jgi:hypothetical protein
MLRTGIVETGVLVVKSHVAGTVYLDGKEVSPLEPDKVVKMTLYTTYYFAELRTTDRLKWERLVKVPAGGQVSVQFPNNGTRTEPPGPP